MIAILRKRRGRAFWITAALILANEVRGVIVVAGILSVWGWKL